MKEDVFPYPRHSLERQHIQLAAPRCRRFRQGPRRHARARFEPRRREVGNIGNHRPAPPRKGVVEKRCLHQRARTAEPFNFRDIILGKRGPSNEPPLRPTPSKSRSRPARTALRRARVDTAAIESNQRSSLWGLRRFTAAKLRCSSWSGASDRIRFRSTSISFTGRYAPA